MIKVRKIIGLSFILWAQSSWAESYNPYERYCDSSTGLTVNQNGVYGSTYCTRHAVMDMQKFEGVCMWHGGLEKITQNQDILCRDGTISELSTLRNEKYEGSLGFFKSKAR